MCIGLASGYIEPKEEKKMSLLKRKTNFDRIKEMTIDEMAERFANVEFNIINEIYQTLEIPINKSKFKNEHSERKQEWKQWLESEAEE